MQHGVALENMVALSSFTFLGIMHREILMDMNDEVGDRAAGVLTLPVVFGACVTIMRTRASLLTDVMHSQHVARQA